YWPTDASASPTSARTRWPTPTTGPSTPNSSCPGLLDDDPDEPHQFVALEGVGATGALQRREVGLVGLADPAAVEHRLQVQVERAVGLTGHPRHRVLVQ